jgi:hypothetical protein
VGPTQPSYPTAVPTHTPPTTSEWRRVPVDSRVANTNAHDVWDLEFRVLGKKNRARPGCLILSPPEAAIDDYATAAGPNRLLSRRPPLFEPKTSALPAREANENHRPRDRGLIDLCRTQDRASRFNSRARASCRPEPPGAESSSRKASTVILGARLPPHQEVESGSLTLVARGSRSLIHCTSCPPRRLNTRL